MGFMKLLEATVKIATTPIDIVADILDPDVVFDEKPSRTKKKIKSAMDDVDEIAD
jgi:hypothetical protein